MDDRLVGQPARVQLLVIAKSPVPGAVKTRMCPPCTPVQAAEIAAAALADTLATVGRARVAGRVLVLEGDLASPPGWRTVPQRGNGLGARLSNGFRDSAARGAASLLIGMDTPQLTTDLLQSACAELARPAADAVLGPAADGGWWALGLRDPRHADVLRTVPMSTAATGEITLTALRRRGLTVHVLPVLRDADTADDARLVADECPPESRFARAVAAHLPTRPLVAR